MAIDEFIADARGVTIEEGARQLGLKFAGRAAEHPQPCPNCGGTDCFAFNTQKNVWNCRHGGVGGHDAIGMAAHCLDLDLSRRAGFLEACSVVLGRPVPDGGERESDEERKAREERLAASRRRAEEASARQQASQQDFRERERQKARGIYESAMPVAGSVVNDARDYLRLRGCGIPDRYLRVAAAVPYWHGKDDAGRPIELHSGPAMVAPFVAPHAAIRPQERPAAPAGPSDGLSACMAPAWELIGIHITWIDIGRAPKFRPVLVDPATGEILPTKKMRGSKKGGLIPLAGSWRAVRWVGGEGIENGLAFAKWEGFRADSFYFAAGDLGNLAGPAAPSSRFAHPTLTRPDRNGVERPVMVPGPDPMPSAEGDDCIPVAAHVNELVLLGDGDSERVMTVAAMARARRRHAAPGRLIPIVWPKPGTDFAGMAAEYEDA